MAAFPIAALLSAGGSIASKLLGKQKQRTPAQNIASTVAGARKAGIHPLAALGSSASGSYTPGSSVSAGSAIGAGLSSLGRGLANQKSRAELAHMQASTDAERARAELLRSQSRTIIQRATGAARGGPAMDDQPPTITAYGGKIRRDPDAFSSAHKIQQEYGDIAENIVGLPSMAWSTINAYGAWERRQRAKARKWFSQDLKKTRRMYRAKPPKY